MSPKPRRPNSELPKRQLLGRERTLVRSIRTQEKGIERLRSKISDKESKIQEHQMELDEVRHFIKEEEWISKGKRVYIIRSKDYTKSKVFYRDKYRWFHLGRTDELKDVSDDELKERTREKFYKSLITNNSGISKGGRNVI